MRAPLVLAFALAASVAAASAHAEIYRFVDAQGTEHFTKNIEDVPEDQRAKALERAQRGARRINVVGPEIDAGSRPKPAPARTLERGPSRLDAPSPSIGTEHYWRSQFERRRRDIELAEQELARAEAADRTSRGGRRSRSASSARSRFAYDRAREERADARVERAEDRLAAAEEAMHELRQRAAARGVPAHWMR